MSGSDMVYDLLSPDLSFDGVGDRPRGIRRGPSSCFPWPSAPLTALDLELPLERGLHGLLGRFGDSALRDAAEEPADAAARAVLVGPIDGSPKLRLEGVAAPRVLAEHDTRLRVQQ